MSNCDNEIKDLLSKKYSGQELEDKLTSVAKLKKGYAAGEKVSPRMTGEQMDVYADVISDPFKYANGMIARQNSVLSAWIDASGSAIMTVAKPTILAGHKAAMKNSAFYKDTISAIRTGFSRVEFFEKMRGFLDATYDSDSKIAAEMQTLGHDIAQQKAKYLTEDLPALDDAVKAKYKTKEEQHIVYQIFSRTGIANIQYDSDIVAGYLNGKMSVEDAIKKVVDELQPSKDEMKLVDDLVEMNLNGVSKKNLSNTQMAGLIDGRYGILVALKSMEKIPGSTEMLQSMDKGLRTKLYDLAVAIKGLNDEINLRTKDVYGDKLKDNKFKTDYDGHYMKDVHEGQYDYKLVSAEMLKDSKYSSEEGWVVLTKPTGRTKGLIARESERAGKVPGIGLNTNRFNNGFYLDEEDSKIISNELAGMSKSAQEVYMNDNNLVKSGARYRVRISEKIKAEKLGMSQNVAMTMYHTFVHNLELVEMQQVRSIALDSARTIITSEAELKAMNDRIARNEIHRGKGEIKDIEVIPMFLKLDIKSRSYDELPVWIKRKYKSPENLSTFNDFNKEITLVRKSISDEVVGHDVFQIFSGDSTASRNLARIEKYYKELVVMAKMKMVVANPEKLAMDAIANMGILGMKDVSIVEMWDGVTEGLKLYKEFSGLRGELVTAQMEARMKLPGAQNRVKKIQKQIENHEFYDSFKAGFVQSYSTSLVVKEFDTVSGLQASIDKIVEGLTKDKKGNPNEVFNAIKMWQRLGEKQGFTIDHLIESAAKLSKVNGTTVGEEMVSMAERLKKNRNNTDSVARYVNELIGGPASEIVKVGSAFMVTADVLSKYTLAKSLMSRTNPATQKKGMKPRLYTKEEAYIEANNTFIDYRRNMPSEIRALSDYGVLMFPNFWIKAQKVIIGLLHYHPTTAIGGYAIADMLDINNASFLDVNIVNKLMNGTVVNEPTNLIDWEYLSWVFRAL